MMSREQMIYASCLLFGLGVAAALGGILRDLAHLLHPNRAFEKTPWRNKRLPLWGVGLLIAAGVYYGALCRQIYVPGMGPKDLLVYALCIVFGLAIFGAFAALLINLAELYAKPKKPVETDGNASDAALTDGAALADGTTFPDITAFGDVTSCDDAALPDDTMTSDNTTGSGDATLSGNAATSDGPPASDILAASGTTAPDTASPARSPIVMALLLAFGALISYFAVGWYIHGGGVAVHFTLSLPSPLWEGLLKVIPEAYRANVSLALCAGCFVGLIALLFSTFKNPKLGLRAVAMACLAPFALFWIVPPMPLAALLTLGALTLARRRQWAWVWLLAFGAVATHIGTVVLVPTLAVLAFSDKPAKPWPALVTALAIAAFAIGFYYFVARESLQFFGLAAYRELLAGSTRDQVFVLVPVLLWAVGGPLLLWVNRERPLPPHELALVLSLAVLPLIFRTGPAVSLLAFPLYGRLAHCRGPAMQIVIFFSVFAMGLFGVTAMLLRVGV